MADHADPAPPSEDLAGAVTRMAGELQPLLVRFRQVAALEVPDSWSPARVAEAEDLTIDLLASLVVTHEVASFLQTCLLASPQRSSPMLPFLGRALDIVGRSPNDPALQRKLAKKLDAELVLVRRWIERLEAMYRTVGNG